MTVSFKRKHGVKYRIYPNAKNKIYFHQTIGCARKMYNERVAQIPEQQQQYHAYKNNHNGSPAGFEYHWLTQKELRARHDYMKIADGLALSEACLNFNKAFNDYTQGKHGKPRFKKKTDYPRTYHTKNQTNNGKDTIYIYENNTGRNGNHKYLIHLPKINNNGGDVPIRLHRPLNGKIKRATIEYTASGEWFIALIIEETITRPSPAPSDDMIDRLLLMDDQRLLERVAGYDLGLDTYAQGSDGIAHDDPALSDYQALEKKLRREQRKLGKKCARLLREGRKLCDCRNYQRQRVRVARLYARIRNKRHDFLHKLSREIVNSHDVIAFEDLHVKGMLMNHCLARGVSDAAWYTFLAYCRYKAEWDGKVFIQCDRWYPSTRTCSCCGALTGPRGARDLGVRAWSCPVCGSSHDRDVNAAANIVLEGLRVLSVVEDARWSSVRDRLYAAFAVVSERDSVGAGADAGVGVVGVGVCGNRWDAGVSLDRETGVYIQDGGASVRAGVFSVADEPVAPKKKVERNNTRGMMIIPQYRS